MITRYRVRVGWLDWTNYAQWSDWFEIPGLAGEYTGSGVPPRVVAVAQSGLVLDEAMKQPVRIGELAPGRSTGRYIPPHRITAVDWEEVQ